MNSRDPGRGWCSAAPGLRHDLYEMLETSRGQSPAPTREPRGCLFALSQPPLMIFLAVIGVLLLLAALHDLFLL